MIRKLKYLAKEHYEYCSVPIKKNSNEFPIYKDGFDRGFKTAFKTIHEALAEEIAKLEQYPMMGERIFAIKLYMKKMDEMLQEIDCE